MHWRYNFTEVTSNLSLPPYSKLILEGFLVRAAFGFIKQNTTFIQAGGPQILLILDFCALGKPVSIAVLS